MPRILVTPRSLTRGGDPALDLLRAAGHELVLCTPGVAPGEEELRRLVPGCVGWLAGVEKITESVLAAASSLKVISRNGTGVDAIDLAACTARGIEVLRADGANARGVAELAIGLLLALLRSIPGSDAGLKRGAWERRQGIEVEGRTLGVVGTGRIGKLVTRFAAGMDMTVVGHDAYPDRDLASRAGFRYAPLAELLRVSDIVTLHCPHEPGQPPLVDAAALGLMKKGAFLVNTARSGLVHPDAVLVALREGRLAGYAVDAYDAEPPAPHPLFAHERVICTPHIGAFTAESVARATRAAVDNLLAALVHSR
jgi:D-3-phosphoglycerate dehydrogenase / 2-oxoglutarate reductase